MSYRGNEVKVVINKALSSTLDIIDSYEGDLRAKDREIERLKSRVEELESRLNLTRMYSEHSYSPASMEVSRTNRPLSPTALLTSSSTSPPRAVRRYSEDY